MVKECVGLWDGEVQNVEEEVSGQVEVEWLWIVEVIGIWNLVRE
jgi:hypothetical protein